MKVDRVLPKWGYALMVMPYIAVFWTRVYNTDAPTWLGIPFFYWYQLLWVLIGMAILAMCYIGMRERPIDETGGDER